MKKILAAVLCVVLAFALVACGGTSTEPTQATEGSTEASFTTMADGVLTVGVEIGYPPFESFASDGVTPVGYDIDVAHEVAAKMGLEVNFINTAFDTIFDGIGSNYDCVISAVTISDERKENMDFSDPYISNCQSIVLKADSDIEITGFESLDGLSVAVQAGTTSEGLMNDYIGSASIDSVLVSNEKVLTCFTQLENGEVDAVLCDNSVSDIHLAENPEAFKIAWVQTENPEQFGIAIAKGDTAFQSALNEALAELESDGTLAELRAKWFAAE